MEKVINQDAVISIEEFGGEKWVRVQALGEDFIIAPKDLDNGKSNFNYDDAMARLKELEYDTFNRKNGLIIAIYIEEINAKLKEAGGNPFARDWYISNELYKPVGSADYNGVISWFFYGDSGCFYDCYRCGGTFRCRPVLALPYQV